MLSVYFDKNNIYMNSFFESGYSDLLEWMDKAQLLPISLKGSRENKIKDIDKLYTFLRFDLNIFLIKTDRFQEYKIKTIKTVLGLNNKVKKYVIKRKK